MQLLHLDMSVIFQSTPSAWRETHAIVRGRSQLHFNPLPPHGGRLPFSNRRFTDSTFQSTPSAWRETHWHNGQSITRQFQSTPSAWRETPFFSPDNNQDFPFSIHSLRMERRFSFVRIPTTIAFQSTPSAWRRPEHLLRRNRQLLISIHSLRMEGDHLERWMKEFPNHFNPLPPHGGRRQDSS